MIVLRTNKFSKNATLNGLKRVNRKWTKLLAKDPSLADKEGLYKFFLGKGGQAKMGTQQATKYGASLEEQAKALTNIGSLRRPQPPKPAQFEPGFNISTRIPW
jgi:hypothetical protein